MSKTREKTNPKFYKSYSPNHEPYLTPKEAVYAQLAFKIGYLKQLQNRSAIYDN